jgi:hypothetical protein
MTIALRRWEIESGIREATPALGEGPFPAQIRVRNFVPQERLSVRASLSLSGLALVIGFLLLWFTIAGFLFVTSLRDGSYIFSAGVIAMSLVGLWMVTRGVRVDFDLKNGNATVFTMGSIQRAPVNPNALRLIVDRRNERYRARLVYGAHLLGRTQWLTSSRSAIDVLHGFARALHGELGLRDLRIEDSSTEAAMPRVAAS